MIRKPLKELLPTRGVQQVIGDTSIEVRGLSSHSAHVEEGHVFFALKGIHQDGKRFIPKALEAGASVIVSDTSEVELPPHVCLVVVDDVVAVMAEMARRYYDDPSSKIQLVGITGTNGKTSVARWCYDMWTSLGVGAGCITTIDIRMAGEVLPSRLTTPDLLELYRLLNHMVRKGIRYVSMEVSSHAIDQRRIEGLRFHTAVFTNISHEHLDYHGDMKSYIFTKKRFFDELTQGAHALVNIDDPRGEVMLQNTKAEKYTYALKRSADYKAKVVQADLRGMELEIDQARIHTRVTGMYNAYNLLACYGVLRIGGFDQEAVLKGLSALRPIEGRMEILPPTSEGVTAIIDYAHTPDALKNLLQHVRKMVSPSSKLIVVFGCGGDRDRDKRPDMGYIAARLADVVVLTSDNPRSEDPIAIIKEIEMGIPADLRSKVWIIEDRAEAIRLSHALAESGDVVIIAGKGHEKYQIIGEEKIPFSDREVWMQLS